MQLRRVHDLSQPGKGFNVRVFRIITTLLAFLLLAAACGSTASVADDTSQVDETAQLDLIDDAAIAELQGKPIVVNFFASWCPSCISELPDFQAVHEELGDEVTFLGVAQRDRPSDALQLIERTGVTYDIGNDPDGDLFRSFNALAMPTTVFLGADGEVIKTVSGVLDIESLTDIINEELL